MNITHANVTASSDSGSNILVLPWYFGLIFFFGSVGAVITIYCTCFRVRKNKRKLHMLISDIKLEDAGMAA
jgi:hypothetical protein